MSLMSQDELCLKLINSLFVFTTKHSIDFVKKFKLISMPHGQSLGWVTCAVTLAEYDFDVTLHESGKFSVKCRASMNSPNINALKDLAGTMENMLN